MSYSFATPWTVAHQAPSWKTKGWVTYQGNLLPTEGSWSASQNQEGPSGVCIFPPTPSHIIYFQKGGWHKKLLVIHIRNHPKKWSLMNNENCNFLWKRWLILHPSSVVVIQSLSRVRLFVTLWTDCSMPGFPVLHHLLELVQTQVHWVGDAIQSSCPLSFPSATFSLSRHQGLFQWVGSSHQVAKVLELQHQSFHWTFRIDFLYHHLILAQHSDLIKRVYEDRDIAMNAHQIALRKCEGHRLH